MDRRQTIQYGKFDRGEVSREELERDSTRKNKIGKLQDRQTFLDTRTWHVVKPVTRNQRILFDLPAISRSLD